MNAIFLFGLLALAVFSWMDLRERRIDKRITLLFALMCAVFGLGGHQTDFVYWATVGIVLSVVLVFVWAFHKWKGKWVMGGADFKVLVGLTFLSPLFLYMVPIGLVIWTLIWRTTEKEIDWRGDRYPGIPAFLIAWALSALVG